MEKRKNILIIILSIAVGFLGGILLYDKVLNKEDKKEVLENNTTKENIENKESYFFETTEELGELLGARDEIGFESQNEFEQWYNQNKDNKDENVLMELYDNQFLINEGKIKFSYPVINIESNDTKRINEEIKNIISDNIDNFKNSLENATDSFCIAVKVNDSIKVTSDISWNEFDVYETKKYLSIVVFSHLYNPCGSSGIEVKKTYIIDKDSKKEITNKEILKEFNISESNLFKDLSEAYKKSDYVTEEFKFIGNESYYSVVDNNGDLNVYVLDDPTLYHFKFQNNEWIYIID